jgi:hypothetical protein
MSSASLLRALTDGPVRPLPAAASALLVDLDAPPRLGAHLRLVHDVAVQLTGEIALRWPGVGLDDAAVHFGAATHDIGKVRHPGELTGPGSAHERAGYELLLAHGVAEPWARFARTHAAWDGPDIGPADLVVSLADKVWKGRRQTDLEQRFLDVLAAATGAEPWEAFLELDDVLGRLAEGAPERLAEQARHPVDR